MKRLFNVREIMCSEMTTSSSETEQARARIMVSVCHTVLRYTVHKTGSLAAWPICPSVWQFGKERAVDCHCTLDPSPFFFWASQRIALAFDAGLPMPVSWLRSVEIRRVQSGCATRELGLGQSTSGTRRHGSALVLSFFRLCHHRRTNGGC